MNSHIEKDLKIEGDMGIAPAILFVGVLSAFRGYFQGKQNFTPSALSNILEQFSKLLFGLILTLWLSKFGVIKSIIGAVIGIFISEVVSISVLFLCYKKQLRSNNKRWQHHVDRVK